MSMDGRYPENAGAILCPWMDGILKMQEQFSGFNAIIESLEFVV